MTLLLLTCTIEESPTSSLTIFSFNPPFTLSPGLYHFKPCSESGRFWLSVCCFQSIDIERPVQSQVKPNIGAPGKAPFLTMLSESGSLPMWFFLVHNDFAKPVSPLSQKGTAICPFAGTGNQKPHSNPQLFFLHTQPQTRLHHYPRCFLYMPKTFYLYCYEPSRLPLSFSWIPIRVSDLISLSRSLLLFHPSVCHMIYLLECTVCQALLLKAFQRLSTDFRIKTKLKLAPAFSPAACSSTFLLAFSLPCFSHTELLPFSLTSYTLLLPSLCTC